MISNSSFDSARSIARRWRLAVWGMLIFAPFAMLAAPSDQTKPAGDRSAPKVLVLSVKGAIGPATDDYVRNGLARAREANASLVLLRIDTPGGLDTAMREIIKEIVASPIPVATYIAPSGARAASAGTYIFYASHVAAMAPGTNLGAATPVQIGGGGDRPGREDPASSNDKDAKNKDKDAAKAKPRAAPAGSDAMAQKAVNDAVAYIRGLAQMRGRNGDWAEKAVREAASLHAEEALKLKVADLIAVDEKDLLAKIEGRQVEAAGKKIRLSLKGAEFDRYEPDWRQKLLAVITDPNVAYILMMLGIYGIFFELWNPGYVLPGVIGGICLLLALYAFQVLPVNYAGLALILLGIVFIVGEVFMPSFGALGIGGVIAFVIGSIILLDTGVEGFSVAWELITVVALMSSAILFAIVSLALRARQQAVVTGAEQLAAMTGEAAETFTDRGWVYVQGERWQARARTPVTSGQRIRVVGRDGLTLIVEPEKEGN